MIKGINHQVIEITDTNNRYYERALLVLKPEYASIEREILEKEARKMLCDMDTISTAKPKSVFLSRLIKASFYIALGAILTLILTTIF